MSLERKFPFALAIQPAGFVELSISLAGGYLLGKYLSGIPWNVLDTVISVVAIVLSLRASVVGARQSVEQTKNVSDQLQLERNFQIRHQISRSMYQRLFLVTLGGIIGLALAWNNWDSLVVCFALLGLGLSLSAVQEAPQRLSNSKDVLQNGRSARVQMVIETPLVTPIDGIQEYWVFIRGEGHAEAGLFNWRALLLEPIPKPMTQLVERNFQAEIWFTPRGSPVLIKYEGVLVELAHAKTTLNRWDAR